MDGGFFAEPIASCDQQAGPSARPQQHQTQLQAQQQHQTQPNRQQQQQRQHHNQEQLGGPGCSRCASVSWNAEWHDAFGMRLCNGCKGSESLISKTNAKAKYYVTDKDLKRLGSLRKANPHKRDWQPMQLFMESQVRALSHEKHGGAEGLEDHAQELLDQRMAERLKRRESTKRKEEQEAAKLDRIKRRLQDEEEQRRQRQEEGIEGVEVEEI